MGAVRLAIDYGSSHTVAVLGWSDGRTRPVLGDGSALLPSGVYAEPSGELLVGRDAALAAVADPSRFEPYPKRRVDDGEILLGERAVPVVDMMAATLTWVADEAAQIAGARPTEVVLTHPASWGPTRRALLRTAAERAGLPAASMLAEPVAAGRYFVEVARERIADGAPMLVYDLGGGTFDVTLLRRAGESFETVVVDGIPDFGGADLDALVVKVVGEVASVRAEQAWPRLLAPVSVEDRRGFRALWESAKLAKESLSRRPTATVLVPGTELQVHVTREQFESLAAPLLTLTVDSTLAALRRAGVQPAELAGIFLVGGATRVPLVGTMLHRALEKVPTLLDQPETVVAEGAIRTLTTVTPSPPPPASQPPPASPPPRPEPEPRPESPQFSAQVSPPPIPVQPTPEPGDRPVVYTTQASRGGAAVGIVIFAAISVVAFALLPGRLGENPNVGEMIIADLMQYGPVAVALFNLLRFALPPLLTVNDRGIIYRGRTAKGYRYRALNWEHITQARVDRINGHDRLVVWSRADMPDFVNNVPFLERVRGSLDPSVNTPTVAPRNGENRYVICKVAYVNGNSARLSEALAQHQANRAPGELDRSRSGE